MDYFRNSIDFKCKSCGKDRACYQRAIRRLHKQCGIHYVCPLSCFRSGELCLDYFRNSIVLGIDKKNTHELVLVCGSTRIPKVQAMIQSINPDEISLWSCCAGR
ncbi:unnamed protein product, partial [Polarella glacialis]